jgi:predicted N-acyltransferase
MIDEIKKIFSNKSFSNFDDFLKYFYFSYDKKISLEKSQDVKNKYIKARKNILSYILQNKQKIIAEINKNK